MFEDNLTKSDLFSLCWLPQNKPGDKFWLKTDSSEDNVTKEHYNKFQRLTLFFTSQLANGQNES